MKKIILFCLVFFMIIKNDVYANELEKSSVDAQGAILIDFDSGRVLWGKNENEPLAMASTTKIMTAILAIERENLEDIVTVSKTASKAPPVKMHLKEGEEIKLKELLYALMMQSSNDAAVAIAEHISGDVDTFCKEMTEKAKEIGAKDTVFRTPNGLDSLDHHSTAYDMAVITQYALNNQIFIDIINKRDIQFTTNKSSYSIVNKNRLLSEFNGANGVKTGYTGKAGHCFVGSAEKNGLRLISVVLASGWGSRGKSQKWVDTKTLLNYGFDNFKTERLLSKDDCKEQITVIKGEKEVVDIYFSEDINMPILESEKDKLVVEMDFIKEIEAPVYKAQKVGLAKVYIDKNLVAEVDMHAKEGVERKTFLSYLKNIIDNWANILNG